MGHSFFTTKVDAELFTRSNRFAELISQSPEAYSLTPEQAATYAALNDAWAAAYRTASNPIMRTQNAIFVKNLARQALKSEASKLASIINGSPIVSDAQRIELGICVRRKRSPKPAPGTPSDFKISLQTLGTLAISWKCDNPKGAAGTMYEIYRQIGGAGEFVYLGRSGTKSYVDHTIDPGTHRITYRVRAVRSTSVGRWANHNVEFGTNASTRALLEQQTSLAA